MKSLILLSTILLLGACATTPTMKSIVGTYEGKPYLTTVKLVFLENGKVESYKHPQHPLKKKEATWKIVEKEVRVEEGKSLTKVLRIESNGDLTVIADIRNGKRGDLANEKQIAFKKIKHFLFTH